MRIGVLTGGGDCPGLNAVIRAIVRKGVEVLGHEFVGYRDGWRGPLEGLTILKTDLWDEAKNTRILVWASRQGARVFGIDISVPTVRQARAAFDDRPDGHPLQGVAGDVRDIPFRDDSFDAIYSMGTIEHFDATERAVAEMARHLVGICEIHLAAECFGEKFHFGEYGSRGSAALVSCRANRADQYNSLMV